MIATRRQVLDKARSQLGVHEVPDGSNKQPFGAWYGMNGVAWCAIFQTWCFAHAAIAGLALIGGKQAYTPTFAKWFYDRGQWVEKNGTPRAGDLVFFAWGTGTGRWRGIQHVGIVESVRSDGRVVTIEGNVGNRVQRIVRSRTYIVGFGRPKYSPEPVDTRKFAWVDAAIPSAAKPGLVGLCDRLGVKLVVRAGARAQAIVSIHAADNDQASVVRYLTNAKATHLVVRPSRTPPDSTVRRLNAPTKTTL